MRTKIGYLGGTDPMFLSHCAALGIDTIPLSNGWDNHGKYIGLLSRQDNVSLVVAPLHKLIAPPEMKQKPGDFLRTCKLHKIPVLVVCPAGVLARARKKLAGARVRWASPEDVYAKAMAVLKRK